MKRILITFVSILIILSSFSICAFAEDVACISLADITVKPGETVEMPVEISDNKGIWGLVFNVCFDVDAFTVKEVRSTGETFNKSDIMIGPADFSVGYVRVVVTPGDVMNNNTNNGTICTIVFEQTSNAVETTYPFVFDYETTDFCDVDANYVTVSSVDGSVNIVGDNNKKTENKPASSEKTIAADKTTVAQTTKTDEDKSGEVYEDDFSDLGDVIAQAEDNKIIDEYAVEQNQPKTEIVTEYKTNKKGEYVTNKKGEKEVIEKVVEITEKESQENLVDLSDDKNETAQTVGSTGNTNVLIYYILGVLVAAGLIALIVVLVIKFKK